jgi:drug/metabolite transporter (DMT)-like permease
VEIVKDAAPPGAGPGALAWTVMLILVVIWGSAFAAIRIGVETIHPAWLVTFRLLVGAAFLLVWIGGERIVRGSKASWAAQPAEKITTKAVLWYGGIGVFFTAIPFLMYAEAGVSVSSGVLAICNGGTPFFTALLAHAFVPGEGMTVRRMGGVALGFLGLAVLVWPEVNHGTSPAFWGLMLGIFGAALYGCSNVAARMAPRLSATTSSLLIVAGGTLAMLVAAPLLAPFPANPSWGSILSGLYLGLMPTGFSFVLWVWLIRHAGSVFTSFTTYLSPLWATAIGVMFLGEGLQWSMAAALALIFAGVAVANRMPRRMT